MISGPTHRFSYIPDPDNAFDTTSVTIEARTEQLDRLLEVMEAYLKGVGFSLDNRHLELLDNE